MPPSGDSGSTIFSRREKLIGSRSSGKGRLLSHTDLGQTWGKKMEIHQILCPVGPSSIAWGLVPGFTLSLVESDLSCMAQIYKHMPAANSGKLAS